MPQRCHSESFAVILSEAKDLALSCFKTEQDSSLPAALSKITSFPRKRESIELTMAPRFRGDDLPTCPPAHRNLGAKILHQYSGQVYRI